MHRLSKAILIILVGLIVLAGLAVVGVNLYIQSPSTQAEIQAALSKATGLPLQITSTTVTPWGGLHMSGISVPAEGGTQLGAKSFHANCRYLELMHGRYIFNEVTLDSPRFVWVQGSDGQWKLPLLPETKVKKAPAVTPSEPRAPKPKAPPISVDALAITNGSLELIDSEKKQVLLVSDLQISASLPDPDKAGGSISLGRITCQNAVNFNNVHAAWHFQDGKLSLTDLASSVAGGAVSGNATVQAVGKANPFQITLHLDHVDLAKIITEAKVKGGEASGLISLELTLQGDAQKFDEATGKGRLTASALQLGQIDSAAAVTATLQDIGALMQISELADLRFDTGESDFHIKDQHAYIDHLLLAAPNIQVSSKGNFRFDGRISFDARLSVSQKLWSRLPSMTVDDLSPPDDRGERSVDFRIFGRADKPKNDLREKLQTVKLFNNMFRGDKKKDKDKDKNAAPSGEASSASVQASAQPASDKNSSASPPTPSSPLPETPPADPPSK